MKNIIPFKKDVIFKTKISEITSISLEHSLSLNNDKVVGEFVISGEYKVNDNSTTVEPFNINLPFEIVIDERYKTDKAIIDIDDFYYEIVNNSVLSISIDVLIDKLEEQPLVELEDLTDLTPVRETLEKEEEKPMQELLIDDNKQEEVIDETRGNESEEKINSLFNQFSKDSDVFVTYNVFILREGDSVDSIMEKYKVTEEELKKYNDLSNLKLGDKLIIPNINERD